jgi:hypothetical protein
MCIISTTNEDNSDVSKMTSLMKASQATTWLATGCLAPAQFCSQAPACMKACSWPDCLPGVTMRPCDSLTQNPLQTMAQRSILSTLSFTTNAITVFQKVIRARLQSHKDAAAAAQPPKDALRPCRAPTHPPAFTPTFGSPHTRLSSLHHSLFPSYMHPLAPEITLPVSSADGTCASRRAISTRDD